MTLRHTVARAVTGVVAVALIGLAVPGQSATAAAAPSSTEARTAPAAPDSAQRGDKPTRDITLRGKRRGDKFSISGKVGPRYPKRFVIIERKFGDGRWTRYNKVRTNSESRYRSRVAPRRDVGKVSYRAKTKKTGTYAVSFSNRIYVITTSRG